MSRPVPWRAVAIELGVRMKNHAHCPESDGGVTIGQPAHPNIEDGLAVDCPFCRDRDAYRRFTERLAWEAKSDG